MNGSTRWRVPVTFFKRLFLPAAAGFMALFAGCRAPLPGSRQRIQEIRSVEVNRVVAAEENNRLMLRFRLKGRDTYAVVRLPGKGSDAQTAMEFNPNAKDWFSAIKKSGRRVPVLGASTWHLIS